MKRLLGEKINLSKSSYYASKSISDHRKIRIEQSPGCKPKSFPLLYLGAPLIKGRSKAVNFEELIKRITSKLEGWKTRFLSFAGKITLIKSVLAGIPIYIY